MKEFQTEERSYSEPYLAPKHYGKLRVPNPLLLVHAESENAGTVRRATQKQHRSPGQVYPQRPHTQIRRCRLTTQPQDQARDRQLKTQSKNT